MTTTRDDPASVVGEGVFDSEAVHASLMDLIGGLAPQRPLRATAEDTLAAVSALFVFRLSWLAYCNEAFGLDPEATDSRSEMCRRWVKGETARAWPYFAHAEAALATVSKKITTLQEELVDFCGHDITALQQRAA
ncbi:hypothetical protein ABZ419_31140 [Streptomyces cinnamoneus]|uniref:hypothetical protein n=1 Tax=Streptomyces cinnamoneus TaxID=53446 RepID=UPI0033F2352E